MNALQQIALARLIDTPGMKAKIRGLGFPLDHTIQLQNCLHSLQYTLASGGNVDLFTAGYTDISHSLIPTETALTIEQRTLLIAAVLEQIDAEFALLSTELRTLFTPAEPEQTENIIEEPGGGE